MNSDKQGKRIERQQPKGAGMYYTPNSLECTANIAGLLSCTTRPGGEHWCDNCKEKYLQPADFVTGGAEFLLQNPPYGSKP